MRDSCIIEQPKRRTTTFGLRSFSYVGDNVWNVLPSYLKETTDLNDYRSLFDTWNLPDLIDSTFSYLWYTEFYVYKPLQSLHCPISSHVYWSLFRHKHFVSLMCICICLYMCVCACIHIHIPIYTWPVHPYQVWSCFWASAQTYYCLCQWVHTIVLCHVIYFVHCTYFASLGVY